jgi:hypothetical protein
MGASQRPEFIEESDRVRLTLVCVSGESRKISDLGSVETKPRPIRASHDWIARRDVPYRGGAPRPRPVAGRGLAGMPAGRRGIVLSRIAD